jgi:hypothetical protein
MWPPLSSYAAVMYAAMLHIIEALIMLNSTAADGSIGMAALLGALPQRQVLAVSLICSSVCAFKVLVRQPVPPFVAILLLVPQQVFLLITGIAAWLAVWHGSYADGVLRSSLFITADQLPRGMFALIHLTAVYAIAAYHMTRPKN